jgi:rhamnogalacturonyl hydrolase YesR
MLGMKHRNRNNDRLVDGIYMADNFYAHYISWYQPKNLTAWDDILKQFVLAEVNLRNSTTGLLKHGYDASKTAVWADSITGACHEVWVTFWTAPVSQLINYDT